MDTQVVIAGAGPTGLTLAAELALAGVRTVVLERLPEPAPQSRAPGVYAGTLETWRQRGILQRFTGHLRIGAYGHFALLPGGLDLTSLDTPHPAALIPQATLEQVLAEWARELGVRIRRGTAVNGVEQSADSVRVHAGETTIESAYLVGCDGGHSTVRALAGFDFPGTASTTDVLLADVAGLSFDDIPLPREPFPFLRNEKGWIGLSQGMGGAVRVFACDFARPPVRGAGPPTFAEVRSALREIGGIDLAAGQPVWLTRFGNATRQVTRNRIGRVLLAGDAAHVHPPFGGQGIGIGIQDAVNLGWKLAADIHGRAPAELLDSYDRERRPAAARVLRLAQAQDFLLGPGAGPLRDVLGEVLAGKEANRTLAAEVTGVALRYDLGDHPLLGRRGPHDLVPDGLLAAARGVLLGTGQASVAGPWLDRVDVVPGPAGLLLRPDGHVAWAAGDTPDKVALETALTRWFGQPA